MTKKGMKTRDINEIFKIYYTEKEYQMIRRAKVMIVGCGGLGSNIANMLVRSGFINIIIVDFDKVELKNLNRQQFYINDVGKLKVEVIKKRLLMINPKAKIYSVNEMIDEKKLEKLIKKFKPDIVVEAVDKEWIKRMIFETSLKLGKTVITASGVAGYGDVENIRIIRREKYTIIGDLVSECGCCNECYKSNYERKKHRMPLAPKVTAVAAMQADEVIRRVIGSKDGKIARTAGTVRQR